jgi:hypothetical protein
MGLSPGSHYEFLTFAAKPDIITLGIVSSALQSISIRIWFPSKAEPKIRTQVQVAYLEMI